MSIHDSGVLEFSGIIYKTDEFPHDVFIVYDIITDGEICEEKNKSQILCC